MFYEASKMILLGRANRFHNSTVAKFHEKAEVFASALSG
jgi:hypothetical protein